MENAFCTILFLFLVTAKVITASEDSGVENKSIIRNKREAVYCKDRYKQWPDHSMCLPRKNQIVGQTDQQEIVRVHNAYRSNVNPPAEDMMKLDWDEELADIAQRWADNCKIAHDTNAQRLIPGRFPVGQNIASSPLSLTWPKVIEVWYNETTSFQYDVSTDLLKIGHFTQLVWASTRLVGCAVSACSQTYFYVCNYGPGGNDGNLGTPYKNGTSCTRCKKCSNKLCDCGDVVCLNGGVLNTTSCSCACPAGLKYYEGNDCRLNCRMGTDHQACGTSSFTANTCSTNTGTVQYCPELCKVCPYAGIGYKDKDTGSHKDTSTESKSKARCITILPVVIIFQALVALVTT